MAMPEDIGLERVSASIAATRSLAAMTRGVDLLGERSEQRILEYLPFTFFQQHTLALHVLRNLAGEGGGGPASLACGDLDDERRAAGQVA